MATSDYLDPIIFLKKKGTQDDPYTPVEESFVIVENKVMLSQIPDKFSKVKISGGGVTGWTEIQTGVPNVSEYRVDYLTGLIFFNSARNGISPTFQYLGTGALFFPFSRIYTKEGSSLDTIQTLEDAVGSALTVVQNASEFRHRGFYDSNTTYYYRNLVDYNNQLFFCMDENVNGVSNIAPIVDSSTSTWRLVSSLGNHPERTDNPHQVTKTQIDLDLVDNAKQIPASLFTKKSQIIYSGDSTTSYQPTALDLGLDGQVLKVNQSVIEWGNLDADSVGSFAKNFANSLPTADATTRGSFIIVENSGVEDAIYFCVRLADGTFAWKQVNLT